MKCPYCEKELKIYKEISGNVLGMVDVLNATDFDGDEEGDEDWGGEINRDWEGEYVCKHCDMPLHAEIVYAHFKGEDKPTYKDTQTLSLFGERK